MLWAAAASIRRGGAETEHLLGIVGTFSLFPRKANASREAMARFRAHLDQVNTDSLRVVATLGGLLVPLFWLLDVWVIPDHLDVTFTLRMATAVAAVVLLWAIRRHRAHVARYVDWLGFGYTWLVSATISVMCWLHAGLVSPYYAGLNLVIVGAGVLFIWPLRWGALFCAVLWGTYMLPLPLGWFGRPEPTLLVSSQFFLFGTIVITLAAQRRRYDLELRSFLGSEALQRTKHSLESAYQALKEHDRLKSQFFSNVTHELRTPLTMILAPLESLLNGELAHLTPRQRTHLAPIHANGIKLLKLINDLLDLAKLEERYMRLRLVRTDLRELLTEISSYARPLAARKDISLRLELRSSLPNLFVDLDKIERAVVNVLSNALKFTDPGGHVTLELDSDEDGVTISVTDDGPGILPGQESAIFERFRQADGAVTRRHGGTGIGLSLAKEIVELHGGRISVTSRYGEGSTFRIHLRPGRDHFEERVIDRRQTEGVRTAPRRGEDREPKEWTQQLQERSEYRFLDLEHATERRLGERGPSAAKATSILVVEDNADLLRFISVQLAEDHAVFVAPDGKKGLELALRAQPDLIITDYMMPEVDGLTLIGELKDDPRTRDIPIVMLSAKCHVEDRVRARGAGADVYLGKPFSPTELRSAIDQLLQRRSREAAMVLREQVRSLEVISAGLAHEIHNPLSSIKTAVFVIGEQIDQLTARLQRGEDASLDQKVQEVVARAQRMRAVAEKGIERIQRIVELVRNYAREGYPAERIAVRLDDAVSGLASLIAAPVDHEVSVRLELGAPDVMVDCIPAELEQVIRNLWQNAMDAVTAGGEVVVRTRRDGDFAHFEVQDDGPGIAREHLGRIFTPFFTTKDPGRGMGLGLAISHQVVTSMGGEISVKSTPGQGSLFRVTVPISGTRAEHGSPAPPIPSP